MSFSTMFGQQQTQTETGPARQKQLHPQPNPADDTSQNPRLSLRQPNHLVSDEGVKFNEAVPKSSIPK